MSLAQRIRLLGAVKGAITAVAIVYPAGFVLGVLRTLALDPALGPARAVAVELPVILMIAWKAVEWAVRVHRVSRRRTSRIVMGVVALGLLLALEVGVAIGVLGSSPAEVAASFLSVPGALGLAAQVCFAAFPLWQRNSRRMRIME